LMKRHWWKQLPVSRKWMSGLKLGIHSSLCNIYFYLISKRLLLLVVNILVLWINYLVVRFTSRVGRCEKDDQDQARRLDQGTAADCWSGTRPVTHILSLSHTHTLSLFRVPKLLSLIHLYEMSTENNRCFGLNITMEMWSK
jgi:hypothetical protein